MVEVGTTSARASTGIVKSPAERVLHHQLLQLKIGLGNRQSLLVGSDRALRAHRFNGSKTADFDLFLGIGERLLRECQRFFLHPLVLVSVDEIPVHIFDLVDGSENLQAESYVREFTVVFGDANEAGIGRLIRNPAKGAASV